MLLLTLLDTQTTPVDGKALFFIKTPSKTLFNITSCQVGSLNPHVGGQMVPSPPTHPHPDEVDGVGPVEVCHIQDQGTVRRTGVSGVVPTDFSTQKMKKVGNMDQSQCEKEEELILDILLLMSNSIQKQHQRCW